jgi:hypothetical protein
MIDGHTVHASLQTVAADGQRRADERLTRRNLRPLTGGRDRRGPARARLVACSCEFYNGVVAETVSPAQAGIQPLDPRLREDDGLEVL